MKYIFTVRGKLRHTDEKEAQKHHDAIVYATMNRHARILYPHGDLIKIER